jgi:hypothetical protein
MAYVPCHSCGTIHKLIPQDTLIKIFDKFQAGEGQVVTKYGIEPVCILDLSDLNELQKIRSRGTQPATVLSSV